MSVLAQLKLTTAKKSNNQLPVVRRRMKVVERLAEQVLLAKAQQDGSVYAPTRQRTVKDAETGERKTLELPKRVKQWWFVADNGKLCVALRYGAKTIALGAKGQTAVELTWNDQLVSTLELLKQAVMDGELDTAIEAVAASPKLNFAKGSVVRVTK
jgi:hypothetical protein